LDKLWANENAKFGMKVITEQLQ